MSADQRLSDHERALYSRQMRLPGVGEAGQLRLREAKVLLLGAGGLGSPVGLYLAAAGVGLIGIADPDKVEISKIGYKIHEDWQKNLKTCLEEKAKTIRDKYIEPPYTTDFALLFFRHSFCAPLA